MRKKYHLKNTRARKKKKKKKNGGELLILIEIFLLLGVGVKFYEFVDRGTPIKSIKLECENKMDIGAFQDSVALSPGKNVFKVNLKDVSKRLCSSPKVRYVQTRRNFIDGKIEISIEKRKPFARVIRQDKNTFVDIDADGIIIGRSVDLSENIPFIAVSGADYPSIPEEEGNRAKGLLVDGLNLIKTLQAEGIKIEEMSELNMADRNNYIFIMKSGTEFHLGNDLIPKKLKRMKELVDQIKDRYVEYVDLRFGDEAVVKIGN